MIDKDIKIKFEKLIPPNDFRHRWEFSNQHLVDQLDDQEKKAIENLLVKKLFDYPGDFLVIETLSYMRSEKAIPAMRISLEFCENFLQKIIVAVSIYEINYENNMIDIAIHAFKKLHEENDLVFAFAYLKELNDRRVNSIIEEYIDSPVFLISHNAKKALGIIKD